MENFFSINLKKLRTEQGLSQSELARRTENICKILNNENSVTKFKPITQGSIARWEANENSPSIDNVFLLSKTLKVPIIQLLDSGDESFSNNQNNFRKKIVLEDDSSIEIITEVPWDHLTEEEQKEIMDSVIEESVKLKKEVNKKES